MTISNIRAQTLADGSVAIHDPESKKTILVGPGSAGDLDGLSGSAAWDAASQMVQTGAATHMSATDLASLSSSTAGLTMLNTGGWPP